MDIAWKMIYLAAVNLTIKMRKNWYTGRLLIQTILVQLCQIEYDIVPTWHWKIL